MLNVSKLFIGGAIDEVSLQRLAILRCLIRINLFRAVQGLLSGCPESTHALL